MSDQHSLHSRTLTSMLSPIPSEPSSSSDTILDPIRDTLPERSQSVPGAESASNLRGPIISEALIDTHADQMTPPMMQRTNSDPSVGQRELSRVELKSFDPLATLSPPAPQIRNVTPPLNASSSSASTDQPAGTSGVVTGASHLLDKTVTPVTASPNTSSTTPGATPDPNRTALHSQIRVGSDQTISSINSYSSAALSSGSFTAISVSPVPSEMPFFHHNHNGHSVVSASSATGRNMTIDTISLTPSAASTSSIPSSSNSSHNPDSESVTSVLSHPVAHLSISTSSRSDRGGSNGGSGGVGGSPIDSTKSVRFASDTLETPGLGRQASGRNGTGDTPSMVRLHDEDGDSPSTNFPPNFVGDELSPEIQANSSNAGPSLAAQGILSPSFPASTPHSLASPPSSDDSLHDGAPLPPVVSALMAAQKVAGTTPGATLAMPVASQSGRLIFLVGDSSGAGKSSVAMGLLHLLLKRGYEPKELAYIKPCTQCEDIQIVSKYCEGMGIAHQGLGPVIFYEGFTAEVIDGKTESVESRRGRISKAVNKIAEGKKWVIVDGVGYAAVGSVAGVSNAEVASLLNAPVLVVGRPGIGNAIDSMNFITAYFEKYHVHALGACWNKIPPMHSYHSYEKCKEYVNKYFRELRTGVLSTYGHIPLVTLKSAVPASAPSGDPSALAVPTQSLSCRLRPAKTDLIMTPAEDEFVSEFCQMMEREFDIELLLGDLQKYYQSHRIPLVSVV